MKSSAAVGVLILAAVLAVVAADDPIQAKLDQARTRYRLDQEKAKKGLVDILERAAESARKDGNRPRMEALKAALEAYEKNGTFPRPIPGEQRLKFVNARAAMNKAYATAVKEFTKANNAAAARATETAWKEFLEDTSGDPDAGKLLNRNSGKYAVLGTNRTTDSAEVAQNPAPKEGKGHTWRLVPVPAASGWFFLQTLDGRYVLGTAANHTNDGSEVVAMPPRSGAAATTQLWQFAPTEFGWGKLVHRASGKVLGVLSRSKADGGKLVIWAAVPGEPNQEWKFE